MGDLREMCLDFASFHREWAAKVRPSLLPLLFDEPVLTLCARAQNLAMWEEAKGAIDAIMDDD